MAWQGSALNRGRQCRSDPAMVRALIAGAALLGLGANEALGLAGGDLAAVRRSARRIGAARMAAGSVLLLRPYLLPALLGLISDGVVTAWLGRLFAVRECALGAGLLAATRRGQDPLPWLLTVSSVDAGEAVVITAALCRAAIRPARGGAFVAADLGSALAGVGALVQRRRVRGNGIAAGAHRPDMLRGAS